MNELDALLGVRLALKCYKCNAYTRRCIMNEYFELIEDSDLENGTQSWIWRCPTCNALFRSKAIHNRSIFAWFGYHPCDGNCCVLEDAERVAIEMRAHRCKCSEDIVRVKTVKQLQESIACNLPRVCMVRSHV